MRNLLLLLALSGTVLMGCGQKGPLYRPDEGSGSPQEAESPSRQGSGPENAA